MNLGQQFGGVIIFLSISVLMAILYIEAEQLYNRGIEH